MSTRLEAPTFNGPVTPQAVTAHLNKCEDFFEVYEDASNTKVADPKRILHVGIKLAEPTVALWWDENRTELKTLATWTDFRTKVLARFVPQGYKTDAVRAFYAIKQGSGEFPVFAVALQTAKAAIGSGKLAIPDQIHKNHLLFFAQDVLMRRVLAIPSFDLETISLDMLTNVMTTTANSLEAERAPRMRAVPSTSASYTPTSTAAMPASATRWSTGKTQEQRDTLQAAGGCFRCGKTPSSPGWTSHLALTCPGDAEHSISPGPNFIKKEPVGAVGSYYGYDEPSSDTSDEIENQYNPASDQE